MKTKGYAVIIEDAGQNQSEFFHFNEGDKEPIVVESIDKAISLINTHLVLMILNKLNPTNFSYDVVPWYETDFGPPVYRREKIN